MYQAISSCRLCGGTSLDDLLDLGVMALTGVFPKQNAESVPAGPLSLVKCRDCHLVQLKHNYRLDMLYGDNYGYRSGLNLSMVRHLHEIVASLCAWVDPAPGDLVIDIGANDSTLLQGYPQALGLELVAIDPTGPKFKQFYPPHVKLIPEFFDASLISRRYPGRRARIITSVAMFYDLEQPLRFIEDIAGTLADDGIWFFEQSYLPAMLEANSYDTICHEHLEYYGLPQVRDMLRRIGLKIVALSFNDVNGGSFAITAARKNAPYPEATAPIEEALRREAALGLDGLTPFERFRREVEAHGRALRKLLEELRRDGRKVLGYGASTKGNVLLQYAGVTRELLPAIAEVNPDKFGAYTPGTGIPIVSEAQAREMKPEYFLVLPWHFRAGILKREQAYLASGGKLIFPLPRIEMVSQAGVEPYRA